MQIRNRLFHLTLGTLLAGSIFGCTPQTVREQSGLTPGPAIDQSNPRATLILGSEGLVGYIRITNPKFRPVGQLNQAQATVQNLTDYRYVLEYKFDWKDHQGFAVGNRGSWHRFILPPRQVETFSSTGKFPEATDILFTVRLPDDAFIEADKKARRESSGY